MRRRCRWKSAAAACRAKRSRRSRSWKRPSTPSRRNRALELQLRLAEHQRWAAVVFLRGMRTVGIDPVQEDLHQLVAGIGFAPVEEIDAAIEQRIAGLQVDT